MLTKNQSKTIAHEIHDIVKKYNPDIKLSSAYSALASAYGYKNWNTMSGLLKSEPKTDTLKEFKFNTAFVNPNCFIWKTCDWNDVKSLNIYNTDYTPHKITTIIQSIINYPHTKRSSRKVFIIDNKDVWDKIITLYPGDIDNVDMSFHSRNNDMVVSKYSIFSIDNRDEYICYIEGDTPLKRTQVSLSKSLQLSLCDFYYILENQTYQKFYENTKNIDNYSVANRIICFSKDRMKGPRMSRKYLFDDFVMVNGIFPIDQIISDIGKDLY